MKLSISFSEICFFAALPCLSLQAAPIISETFDKAPSADLWQMDASGSVVTGALVLSASGPSDTYGNSQIVTREGNPAMDFTAKPIEIEFKDLSLGGTALPGENLMAIVFSSDVPGEGKSSGYFKIRMTDDGAFTLNYGGAGVKDTVLYQRTSGTLIFPLRSFKLRFSVTDFSITWTDTGKDSSGGGKWAAPFDAAVWKGSAPYLMIRAVRRPGDGKTEVRLGALTVNNVK